MDDSSDNFDIDDFIEELPLNDDIADLCRSVTEQAAGAHVEHRLDEGDAPADILRNALELRRAFEIAVVRLPALDRVYGSRLPPIEPTDRERRLVEAVAAWSPSFAEFVNAVREQLLN